MFNSILQALGSELEQNVLRSIEGTGYNTVRFLNLNGNDDTLQPNALNIVLFGTKAERDIMGISSFNTPTTDNMGIEQKPPLKLSVDVLFIFNFNNYKIALSIYSQVLGHFYNHDVINIPFEGYPNQVQILLSSFNDRDEIELWNSFGIPGTPILRYDLKYVMISGKATELPFVKTVGVDAGVLTPEDSTISALVINMIYYPVEDFLKEITQYTNTFCSLQLTGDIPADNQTIETSFNELIESYSEVQAQIIKLKEELIEAMELDPAYPKLYAQFNPYLPSIDGLLILLETDKNELKTAGANPSVENYTDLCQLAKSFIDPKTGLTISFLKSLELTSMYLLVTDGIDKGIINFDLIGESTYGGEGSEKSELSITQLRIKWWELEDALKKLSNLYVNAAKNPLFDFPEKPYMDFKVLLETCNEQITDPLEALSILNNNYNQTDGDKITPAVEMEYKKVYDASYQAVNYIESELVPVRLAEGLQRIFEEQNK